MAISIECLDEPAMTGHTSAMSIPEGFPGERLRVLPRPLVSLAQRRTGSRHLLVTDCGYFPRAQHHGRSREKGIDQAIVIVCAEGRGWCRIDGVEHKVAPGQALVIPPGVPHVYGTDAECPWTIWWFHVIGAEVGELLEAARVSAARPVATLADPYRVIALIDEILLLMEHDDSQPAILAATGAAWHALALLAAYQSIATNKADPVALATAYLKARVGERVGVDEVAAVAGLSASHFSAVFRKVTGFGVIEYQTRLRMAQARDLLDTTSLSVARIAKAVGYADAFYFSRQFRAVHGVPPSEYRSAAKG